MKLLLLFILLLLNLEAKVIITPFEAIHKVFGKDVQITKKNKLFSSAQAHEVSQLARTKLSTKIYRIFQITQDDKLISYAFLTINKMRTKDAAVLFILDLEGKVVSVETIAFGEPSEYAPSKKYQELFLNQNITNKLRVGKEIPTMTGATLSARGYSRGARVALALFEVLYKK